MLDWRAASWLPVYLLGMGAIVYVSSFGPDSTPVLPFGWDMAVVAVFSFAIYYWAIAVSLTREQIEEMLEEVVLPEQGMEPVAH
jgi:hypothetical protein